MARGRDLAGLAALAGLAYMANKKGKETTGVDPDAAMGATPSEDAGSFGYGDASGAAVDTTAMADMGPRGAPAAAPTRSAAKATAAAPVRTPGNRDLEKGVSRGSGAGRASRYDYSNEGRGKERLILGNTTGSTEEGMKGYVPRRAPAANPDYGNEGRTYESKAKSKAKYETPYDRMNRENREAGIKFKKGGTAKKMANGGVASASKRADGIASRGKTKCKMY
jgi:hypothetical protein